DVAVLMTQQPSHCDCNIMNASGLPRSDIVDHFIAISFSDGDERLRRISNMNVIAHLTAIAPNDEPLRVAFQPPNEIIYGHPTHARAIDAEQSRHPCVHPEGRPIAGDELLDGKFTSRIRRHRTDWSMFPEWQWTSIVID